MAVAVRVIVLTGDGILEETVDVRVGAIPAVAVVAGATCPQPANRIATKSTKIMSKIRLDEFISGIISSSGNCLYWLKRQFVFFDSGQSASHHF